MSQPYYESNEWANKSPLKSFSGNERARLLFQAASLGVLGIWQNTPITKIDLVNLSLGQVAAPAE
mgnify:CR=1 FL=1